MKIKIVNIKSQEEVAKKQKSNSEKITWKNKETTNEERKKRNIGKRKTEKCERNLEGQT